MPRRRRKKDSSTVLTEDEWDPSDTGDVPVSKLIEAAVESGKFVYDLETTGLNPRRDRIEGVAFYVPPKDEESSEIGLRAWYPFIEGTMDYSTGAVVTQLRPALNQVETMEELRELFSIPELICIRHNGTFDDGFLYVNSGCEEPIVVRNQIADSMLADYIADERLKRYGLKIRVEQVFKHKMTTYNDAAGRQGVFGFARKKPLGAYAMDDCVWTWRLWRHAMDRIREQDPEGYLEKIYWKIEMEIQKIIIEMETTGCLIDWQWLVEVQKRLERQKLEILEQIKEKAGWVPNLRSPKQVSDFLYKSPAEGGLGLPTDGLDYNEDLDQYTTADKVISFFGKKEPVVELLLKYRSLEVVDRSFCQKLIAIGQNEERCFSHFRQTGTVIGRLSSADPINLQNQPRDKNLIRKAFCAHYPDEFDPERRELIWYSADFSQMELRMAAHLANEQNMIEVYTMVGGCKAVDGAPCERYRVWTCESSTCGHAWAPDDWAASSQTCPKCNGTHTKHQARCRHVDLHQRTSEDVGVKRNPLAKCLDGSTLILPYAQWPRVRTSWPKSIESVLGGIEPGEHRVLESGYHGLSDGRGGLTYAQSGLKRHSRPTKIVVTKRAVVIATNDHRFQVIGDYGTLDPSTPGYKHEAGFSLVEAYRLEPGMQLPVAEVAGQGSDDPSWHEIATPVELRLNPFTKEFGAGPASVLMDERWGYFAGVFHGDGCASGNACAITHGSSDDYAEWRDVVRAACDDVGLPTSVSGDRRQTRLGSRIVRRYLEGMGLKERGRTGAKHMRVPDWVMQGGPRIIWSYLAGLFDTDGTVGGSSKGTASFTTRYPEFAGQVAFLLRWLGMPVLVQPGFNKTYERWYYTIHVLGEGLERFLRYCPMRFSAKVERLRERCATIKRKCAPNTDEVLLVIDGGKRTVYDFQVDNDDHLYLQGGLIGHNNLNFGLLYRMGASKFVTYADLYDDDGKPRVEYAESLIEKWHKAYPGIATWHARIVRELSKNDYIAYTLTKRRRRLDQEFRRNEFRAGTQAIQFMVSGSCQDIMKLAMVRIAKAREEKINKAIGPAEARLWRRFKFLIQVHDEINMEGPRQIEPEAKALIRDAMENVAPNLRVPMLADVKSGRTWDEAH